MIETTTLAAPEAVLAQIRAELPTPSEWMLQGAHQRTPFYGKTSDTGFWVVMRRNRWERNSFNPVMVGRVSPAAGGSRITATIRLARPVQIFMTVWLMMTLFLCVAGLLDLARSGVVIDKNTGLILAVAVPVVVLTVGIAVFIIRDTRKKRGAGLEEWLRIELARLNNSSITRGANDRASQA